MLHSIVRVVSVFDTDPSVKTGSFYIGTVSHFTWWNCDYPGDRATIKGRVIDCGGNPLPNVTVTIAGFLSIITDQNLEILKSNPDLTAYKLFLDQNLPGKF